MDKCKIVFHKRKHVLSPPAIQHIPMLVFEFNFLSEFVLHACIRMLSPKIMIGKSCAESSLTFGPKNLLRGNNSSFLRAQHQYSSCWPSSVSDPSSSFNHYVGTAPHSNDSYHPSCCIKFVPSFLPLSECLQPCQGPHYAHQSYVNEHVSISLWGLLVTCPVLGLAGPWGRPTSSNLFRPFLITLSLKTNCAQTGNQH